jgi:hypothetical protein
MLKLALPASLPFQAAAGAQLAKRIELQRMPLSGRQSGLQVASHASQPLPQSRRLLT